jgi:hypothetical protein
MRTARFAPLALALCACGDPLLFAEVEDEKICMTFPRETIPGADQAIVDLLGNQKATWHRDLNLGSGIPGLGKKGTTGTIKMISLTVHGDGDITSITDAKVELTDVDPPTRLMQYKQQQPVADTTTITMTLDQDVDLFQRLGEGTTIPCDVTLSGRPPPAAWTADITACMSARVKIDPLEMMKK